MWNKTSEGNPFGSVGCGEGYLRIWDDWDDFLDMPSGPIILVSGALGYEINTPDFFLCTLSTPSQTLAAIGVVIGLQKGR